MWDLRVNEMVTAATQEMDRAKREQMYLDIQKKLQEEGPYAIMFQQVEQSVKDKDVEGHKDVRAPLRSDDDTEGHRRDKIRGEVRSEEDDVEGHRRDKIRGEVRADDEDVEGHKWVRGEAAASDEDDTEGHAHIR